MSVIISPPPKKILWCYGVYQNMFRTMPEIEFHEGLPDLNRFDGSIRTLLILDDLMSDTDSRVSDLFTKISHHSSVSVIFITQNLFFANKVSRTIALNAQYLVLFQNPRDASQITHLARQMFPGHSGLLTQAFRDATSQPYSYLLIDLKPDTDEKHRLRANIFPGETNFVYVHK